MPYAYSLLPTHKGPDRPRRNFIASLFLSRRYTRFFLIALLCIASFVFLVPHDTQSLLSTSRLWALRASAYPPYPVPRDSLPPEDPRPPLYQRYTAYEEALPQHDDTLSFPEGSHAKFIFFANHGWGAGWGNAMQEMVLNAHLAYASGRAFVFDNYTWDRDGPEYSDFNGKLIPSRIPLSAIVAGPLSGHPYSNSTVAATHPRFVSRYYYNQVCPEPYILNSGAVKATIPSDASALQTLNVWVAKLQSIEHRCVEIKKDTPQLFDIWLIGSSRLHDILPSLSASPVVRDFAWSPLVHYAFQKNQHHFTTTTTTNQKPSLLSFLFPRPRLTSRASDSQNHDTTSYLPIATDFDLTRSLTPTPPTTQTTPLPLLALHLRRGDFIQHCDHLYQWGSTYTGYNTLPQLPDRFFAENATLKNEMSEEEVREGYRDKCLVDVDKVRKRVVRAVREWREERLRMMEREKRGKGSGGRSWSWTWWWRRGGVLASDEERVRRMLRKVYIMTNGDREWLDQLKAALYEDARRSANMSNANSEMDLQYDYDFEWSWDEISTSRDLELGWEAKYVAQAVDMYVGQRAEVFVGNGFSSLTANVVLLRTVAGVEPWRTRFW